MTEMPGTKYQWRAAEIVGSYFGCSTTTAVRERSRLVNLIAKAIADAETQIVYACSTAFHEEKHLLQQRIAELEDQLATWELPEGHVWVKVHKEDVASLRAIQRVRDADGAPMYGPQALDRQEAHIQKLETERNGLESRLQTASRTRRDLLAQIESLEANAQALAEAEAKGRMIQSDVEDQKIINRDSLILTLQAERDEWQRIATEAQRRIEDLEDGHEAVELLREEIRKLTERVLAQTAPPVLETDKQESL